MLLACMQAVVTIWFMYGIFVLELTRSVCPVMLIVENDLQ